MISSFVRRTSAAYSPPVQVFINASVRSPNLAALAAAAGWVTPRRVNFIIAPGVNVAALAVSGFAHDVVSIVNQGTIGGVIGAGVGITVAGQRISIQNSGTIFGGGGYGATGGSANATQSGGGVVSATGGAGGYGAGFSSSGAVSLLPANPGSAGSFDQWSGAIFPGNARVYAQGGTGGTGGAVGAVGGAGSPGTWGGTGTGTGYPAEAPGNPGAAVNGNSLVTWITLGTILGARIG